MLNQEVPFPLRSLVPPNVTDRGVTSRDEDDELDALAARHFGFSGLYGWQREAIEAGNRSATSSPRWRCRARR